MQYAGSCCGAQAPCWTYTNTKPLSARLEVCLLLVDVNKAPDRPRWNEVDTGMRAKLCCSYGGDTASMHWLRSTTQAKPQFSALQREAKAHADDSHGSEWITAFGYYRYFDYFGWYEYDSCRVATLLGPSYSKVTIQPARLAPGKPRRLRCTSNSTQDAVCCMSYGSTHHVFHAAQNLEKALNVI